MEEEEVLAARAEAGQVNGGGVWRQGKVWCGEAGEVKCEKSGVSSFFASD